MRWKRFEPAVIRSSVFTYRVSQRIHEDGFRVALCGEGADELFAGYEPLENAFKQAITVGFGAAQAMPGYDASCKSAAGRSLLHEVPG